MNSREVGWTQVFKVKTDPKMVNKTFRLPKPLVDDLDNLAKQECISLNNLVTQCCEYALGSMAGSAERRMNRKAVEG